MSACQMSSLLSACAWHPSRPFFLSGPEKSKQAPGQGQGPGLVRGGPSRFGPGNVDRTCANSPPVMQQIERYKRSPRLHSGYKLKSATIPVFSLSHSHPVGASSHDTSLNAQSLIYSLLTLSRRPRGGSRGRGGHARCLLRRRHSAVDQLGVLRVRRRAAKRVDICELAPALARRLEVELMHPHVCCVPVTCVAEGEMISDGARRACHVSSRAVRREGGGDDIRRR